ncbi:MAG: DUF5011 domain-containing protein [Candidatus Marinimicrobia bacterium]|nr:DUF5011 domain-containing protein [Candidatus Neomarinimicrobiota bacterium]
MNNQKTSLRMILSITMVLLFMAPNLYANLVTNGSFEGTGAGWSKSGNVWIHGGIVHYNEFDSGISGNVWQYIPTVVGQEYRLEFDYCGHGNTAADKTKLRIYVGTTPVLIDVTESASTTPWDWRHATYTFVAQQTSTRLYFRDASTLSYQVDLHLDNVSAVQSYPPTPDAGADQIIGCVVDNTDVTLDGSESIDLDGDAMSYSWTGSFGTVAGISPTINLGLGVHPITLTVTDAVGSTATDDVTVTVNADTEAPIITLLGDNPTNLFFRDSYVEVGYTVSDDCDAGPAVEVTGTVNTESPGTYTLTYTTTDEVGNVGTAQRTVTVNSLLVNGGFEGSGSGWSRSGNVWIHGSVVHFNEHDRTANGSINQYVNTVVGQQYRLEFDYCAHGTTTSGGMRVRAHVGPSPVVLDQTLTASTVSWEWRHASYTFTAQLTSTRIWLGDSSTRTYQCDMHLNNATLIEYNPPTAVAGSDFTEVVPLSANATVTLDASASINPEDIPLSYNWSGPFGSVSGISPIVQLAPGIHTITLSIDDGIGPTVTDDIVVTIAEVNLPINGLIGYWPADGNADDVTGNFDGTLGANTVFEAGLNDQAFSFDAAQSSNVSLPVNLSPSNLPQMTMGMFVQLRSVATSSLGWVIGHDNGGYDRSLILHDYRYGSGLAAGVGHTYGSTLPKLKDNLNRWYFIAVAYDQSTNTATTYVNDLTGDGLTQTVTTSLGSGLPTASLGGLTFSNHGVHGLVDEVFMFNRTLTPAELDEICFDLAPNYIPTANAGVDQTIECVVFNGSVTLDGLGSSDPDGDPLGYSWTLDGDVLSTEATFEATVPTGSTIFTLTVNDGLAFASDEVVVTAVGDTEPPLITLDGDNPMDIGLYDEYVEAGYSAVDACETAFEFVVVSTVDVNTPDTYEITYTVEDAAGNSDVATRMVNVINTPPVTVAGEDQSFDCIVGNTSVTLDGSESTDSDGGTLIYSWALDGAVVSTEASFTTDLAAGDHTFTLTVSDGFDSSSDDILVTIVADTEPPLITLAGENPMDLGLYLEYLEPGYSAVDACESVVTIDTTRTLNINAPGSYTITYTATDEGGNFSTEVRTVNVINTAPEVVNAVDDVVLSFGDDILSAEIDLATVFADIDVNDVLVYTYNNPNADAATASLSGSILTLNAVDLGESLVEITATDPWLLSASQSFTVTVNVTTDLADAVLFAFSEIKLDKEVEVNTGNILVNDTRSADDEDEDEDEEDSDDE